MPLIFIFCGTLSAAPLSEEKKIEALLVRIETSGIRFIRNGIEYSGARARKHMELKLSRAGGRIKTAEHFIRFLATKSSTTGILYYVKLPGGKKIPSAEWLRGELRELERG